MREKVAWVKSIDKVFTITASSTKILDENTSRKYLCFQNRGTVTVVFTFGSAQASDEGFHLLPNNVWEPLEVPGSAIYAVSLGMTTTCEVIEGYW